MTDCLLIYTTFPDKTVAESLCQILIEKKLIACANILGPMDSLYHWEGKLEKSTEVPALLKSSQNNFDLIKEEILKRHPYSCPCILALPISSGLEAYLNWLKSSIKSVDELPGPSKE